MRKLFKFKGVSQKGKNRIKEHGQFWICVGTRSGVNLPFTNDNDPWGLFQPTSGTECLRWVNFIKDKDFEIVE
jgi:hypothetical protein